MQRVIDRRTRPETNLYKSRKRLAGGDPAVPPRHGIHPERVMGGWYNIGGIVTNLSVIAIWANNVAKV